MKKVLGILGLAVGLTVASSANAAILRMDFGGGASEITVLLSQNFTIDVWLDRPNDGSTVSGASMEFSGDASLVAQGNSTTVPGWAAAGNIGVLTEGQGAASHQFLVGATPGNNITGVGSTLLGSITVHPTLEGSFPIVFNLPSNPAFFVTNAVGGDYPFNSSYGQDFDSYITFGLGSPTIAAAKKDPGQAASPITVHVVPEPAALALLGLGAIVALRRKVA